MLILLAALSGLARAAPTSDWEDAIPEPLDTTMGIPTDCEGWAFAGALSEHKSTAVRVALPLGGGRYLLADSILSSLSLFEPGTMSESAVSPPFRRGYGGELGALPGGQALALRSREAGKPWSRTRCALYEEGRFRSTACPSGWDAEIDRFSFNLVPVAGGLIAFDGRNPTAMWESRTRSWRALPTPDLQRGASSVALSGDVVLFFDSKSAYILDVRDGALREVAPPPPGILVRPQLVVLADGRLLAASTRIAKQAPAQTFFYDLGADAWSAGPPLAHPRSSATMQLLPDGSVLLVGGWDAELRLVRPAERLFPGEDAWVSAGRQCIPRTRPVVLAHEQAVYVLGGGVSHGTPTETGLRFTIRAAVEIEGLELVSH